VVGQAEGGQVCERCFRVSERSRSHDLRMSERWHLLRDPYRIVMTTARVLHKPMCCSVCLGSTCRSFRSCSSGLFANQNSTVLSISCYLPSIGGPDLFDLAIKFATAAHTLPLALARCRAVFPSESQKVASAPCSSKRWIIAP